MQIFSDIQKRVRKDYFQWRYLIAAKAILRTPPLSIGQLPFMLLSMVHQRDVISYLVAVKSFARHANPTRVVVVCDPSIDETDRATLRAHVPHIELVSAADFTHPDIPRGGCWERLFAISHYVTENYVVQLDADTVTAQPIAEVVAAIHQSKGFVLGEETNQKLLSLEKTHRDAKARLSKRPHIQTYSEVAMAEVALPVDSLYVRGCAGFTGFPKTANMREQMLDFSRRMTGHFGLRWSSWGTEQVTSNYLVANAPGTTILPFPKYGTPDVDHGNSAFVHFIGSMRFINKKYQNKSLEIINLICSSSQTQSAKTNINDI